MTTDRILARLSTSQVQHLSLEEIIATPELQKRRPEAMTSKAQTIDKQERQRMIENITASLKSDPKFESSPLKVVRCAPDSEDDGIPVYVSAGYYLVDGFHRYAAYLQAGRKTVPVHCVEGTWDEAHEAATIMNNHTQTVGVDRQQKLQQAWELVRSHYDHEGASLERDWSARRIARSVGVSRQAVDNMVMKIRERGDSVLALTWKEARSSAPPQEISHHKRLVFLVRKTLELADLARDDHDLRLMTQVLQDEQENKIGYDPDLDEYVDRWLEADAECEEF